MGANWADTRDGGLAVSTQQVAGTNASANSGDTWTADTFNSDQYSQIQTTATPLTGGQWIGVAVRDQNNGLDAYVGIYYWNNGHPCLELFKRTNENWTGLGSTYNSGPLPAGTTLTIAAVGSAITLQENGVTRVSATDNTLTGGAPAIMAYDTPTTDNWTGGNQTQNTQPVDLWYHHDQQGSTRLLTTNSATIAGTATYDPYGNTTATTGTTTPLGYTGAYTNPQTGLIYLINRYYDPTTAQFLTVDPAVGLTHARYSYVNSNPLNDTDPLGLAGSGCPTSDPTCTVNEGSPGAGTPPPCGGDPTLEPACPSAGTSLWTVLTVVGTAAGVAAFATGIGELAAGAIVATEGGEAVFLGVSADTYGVTSLASQGVAAVLDFPGCVKDPALGSCAGLVLNVGGFGLGVLGGAPTWANGITLTQGLNKALAASGGVGVTAWDALKAWAESTLGVC